MSEGTRNSLDNSEFNTANTNKDIAPASVSKSEEERLFDYMKMLKMRAEIEKDRADLKIGMKTKTWTGDKWQEEDKEIQIVDLLPVDSEFEKTRKLIIISLNKAGPESESFRKYASRFGSNSIFDLSSKITNYVLDEKRRRETYSDLLGDPLKHA